MIRDAKLYYLNMEDWTPIKEAIESHPNKYHLINSIAIYKKYDRHDLYVILSVDDKIDEIVEKNCGKLAKKEDLLPKSIKKGISYLGTQIFGASDLTAYLIE